MGGKIVQWDVSKTPWPLEDESVDVVVTSPPYWGLRDYGKDSITIWGGDKNCKHNFEINKHVVKGNTNKDFNKRWGSSSGQKQQEKSSELLIEEGFCNCGAWSGQLGLEPHPSLYVNHIIEICRQIKRVLKDTGSFYLNIGDTYFGSGCGYNNSQREAAKEVFDMNSCRKPQSSGGDGKWLQPKQLLGIPFRVMAALQDDGWILRNIMPWIKSNAMPSPVKDRRNTTWEPVFHFVKSQTYDFDLDKIREPHKYGYQPPKNRSNDKHSQPGFLAIGVPFGKTTECHPNGKNPGDVLEINTVSSPEAHYAVFPEELVKKLLLPHKGSVLDPFCGRGTTGKASKNLSLDYILFDIDPHSIEVAKRYIAYSDNNSYRKLTKRLNKQPETNIKLNE